MAMYTLSIAVTAAALVGLAVAAMAPTVAALAPTVAALPTVRRLTGRWS